MVDVTIKYKDNIIAEMSGDGTKTLSTAGKYCEDDIQVTYVAPVEGAAANFKIYEITLAKSSGWVKLATLTSDVLAHINDARFAVILLINDEYSYVNYSGCCYLATNTPFGMVNTYPVYGYSHRQGTENVHQLEAIFYPANNTGTASGLGGKGIFRIDGSNYYLKPSDGFIKAGTYRLIFTW